MIEKLSKEAMTAKIIATKIKKCIQMSPEESAAIRIANILKGLDDGEYSGKYLRDKSKRILDIAGKLADEYWQRVIHEEDR